MQDSEQRRLAERQRRREELQRRREEAQRLHEEYRRAQREAAPPKPKVPLRQRMAQPVKQMLTAIDRRIPNPRNRDEMAIYLAQRTPRALAICIGLLLAGVIASRLGVWAEGFLWGIPSLGAISMGVGWWVWSSNLAAGPLSPEVRAVLHRAIRLQYLMLSAFGIGVIYFGGMAARLW
jgi:hypothetical protein